MRSRCPTCARCRTGTSPRTSLARRCARASRRRSSTRARTAAAVLDALAAQGERGTLACAGPRYFGFVIGGTLPGRAGRRLADQRRGTRTPASTRPRRCVVGDRGSRRASGCSTSSTCRATSSVGFVTGCQMANFTGLAAARHGVLRRAGWDVEEDGLHGAPRINLVTSAESHVTDRRRAALPRIRHARVCCASRPTGRGGCAPTRCARLLDNLHGPDDRLRAGRQREHRRVRSAARDRATSRSEHGAWLHVDGAFGLWARASADAARISRDGIELRRLVGDRRAQVAERPVRLRRRHRARIAEAHRAAMTVDAPRTSCRPSGVERDAVDWVPEFSRRAPRRRRSTPRCAHLGRDGVEALIDRCCAHAAQMAELLRREPRRRDPQRRRAQPGAGALRRRRRRSRAQSSPACSRKARAGSAARRGTGWPRCASRSRTGRPARTTCGARPRRSSRRIARAAEPACARRRAATVG